MTRPLRAVVQEIARAMRRRGKRLDGSPFDQPFADLFLSYAEQLAEACQKERERKSTKRRPSRAEEGVAVREHGDLPRPPSEIRPRQ